MREVCIPTLQHIFNLSHNAHLKKSLDYEISVVAYTMHTNNEWCIILFQLNYHTYSNAWKHIHPISSKCN